jgi:hypothetical protein
VLFCGAASGCAMRRAVEDRSDHTMTEFFAFGSRPAPVEYAV